MTQFSFETDILELRALIENLVLIRLEDGEKVKETIIVDIRKGIDFSGKPFKPLSPFTIARKGSDVPLIDTGRLIGSFAVKKTKRGVQISNTAPYSADVNAERPFLVIGPRQLKVVTDSISLRAQRRGGLSRRPKPISLDIFGIGKQLSSIFQR